MLAQQVPVNTKQNIVGTYEDDQVKLAIPRDWKASVEQEYDEKRLLLEKNGYTLTLAFRTQHASGIDGGRFYEAFQIPWLKDPSQIQTCSLALQEVPRPASRALMFVDILLDTSSARVREHCGLDHKVPESITVPGAAGKKIVITRWFAGYFTAGAGGWFIEESRDTADENCESKLYTLTSSARQAGELPVPSDANLQRIIREAIDIVNSIQYKRCAPVASSPFN